MIIFKLTITYYYAHLPALKSSFEINYNHMLFLVVDVFLVGFSCSMFFSYKDRLLGIRRAQGVGLL